jgi:N-acetylmuramoyl-L-alanine amidase
VPSTEAPETTAVHPFPSAPPPQAKQPVQPIQHPATSNPPQAISEPTATWASLESWAEAHALNPPERLEDSPVAAYTISSKNGTMVLEIGSREATWNGAEITLGFAPQFIDGEIALHGLDLQKNLQPLLCTPPLTFAPGETIVIDPGHGGSNVGTHSVLDGRFEKEFTLDLAKRLKPLLEAEGWKVFLTRESDVLVTNSNRVVFSDMCHANLFISLHFNSGAPDTTQAGLETYCLTPTGEPSTVTRTYADPWSENLPNNIFDTENLQLAVHLHEALLHRTQMRDRGVRRARFIEVLRGQKRPAILIEAGYLSNPAEAARIENGEYRQKLAEIIAASLKPNAEGK